MIDLSVKTALLLALTCPLRSSDLAGLALTNLKYIPEGEVFSSKNLAKQSHAGRPGKEFFFPSFPDNPNLCPVNTCTLKADIERNEDLKIIFL